MSDESFQVEKESSDARWIVLQIAERVVARPTEPTARDACCVIVVEVER
jgi:hypothetical protein